MNGQFNFGDIKPTRYFLFISITLGLLFAFVSQEDEANSTITNTALFFLAWQIQTIVPTYFAILIQTIINTRSFKLGAWSTLIISGTIAAAVFSPLATLVDFYFLGERDQPISLASIVAEMSELSPPFILAWVIINTPFLLGWRIVRDIQDDTDIANDGRNTVNHTKTEQEGFLALLPKEIGNNIILIRAELHYINVYTSKGESLVLYSLAKASIEMGDELGMQVHRSYWINFSHVANYRRQAREALITLTNGQTISVSRRQRATLEANLTKRKFI